MSILALLLTMTDPTISFCYTPITFISSYRHQNTGEIISKTTLFGKGFRGVKNKQAALVEKMRLAKKQQTNEGFSATRKETKSAPREKFDTENDSIRMSDGDGDNDISKEDSAH